MNYRSNVVDYYGTGRRKCSVAKVRIMVGAGRFLVNSKDIKEYFFMSYLRDIASGPILALDLEKKLDVVCSVSGGGLTGQAGAVRHGLAKAILEFDSESYKAKLKSLKFLTRDDRVKERKKYGLKAARKRPQYSKR